jgi:hypothetical protein
MSGALGANTAVHLVVTSWVLQALSEQEDELASLTAVVRTHNLMTLLRGGGAGGGSKQPPATGGHAHNNSSSNTLAMWRAGRLVPGVSSDSSDDDEEEKRQGRIATVARRGGHHMSSDTDRHTGGVRDQHPGGSSSRRSTAAPVGGRVPAAGRVGLSQVEEGDEEDQEEGEVGSPGLVAVPGTSAAVSARRLQVASSLLSGGGGDGGSHGLSSITRHSMPGLKSLSMRSGVSHRSHSVARSVDGVQGAVQSRLLELTGRYREAAKRVGAV